jgi:hypothetical protein
MLKCLRIAVTALGLTACVLLVALWVRSFNRYDYISALIYGSGVSASSHGAILTFSLDSNSHDAVVESFLTVDGRSVYKPGFTWTEPWQFLSHRRRATIPHWFFVAVFGLLAALPWSRRFSLRALQIAMTLIAMMLALIVATRL